MLALERRELRPFPAPVTIHGYQTRYHPRNLKAVGPRDTNQLFGRVDEKTHNTIPPYEE
jgi:hypothetical protein